MQYILLFLFLASPPDLLNSNEKVVKPAPVVKLVDQLKAELSAAKAELASVKVERDKLAEKLESVTIASSAAIQDAGIADAKLGDTKSELVSTKSELEKYKTEMETKYGKVVEQKVQLETAKTELEQKYGAKIDLFNTDSPAESEDYDTVRAQRDGYRAKLDANSGFSLSGLSVISKESTDNDSGRHSYILITTSRACSACPSFIAGLKRTLVPLKWTFGNEKSTAHFREMEISQQEWDRLQCSLPQVHLVQGGIYTPMTDKSSSALSNALLNAMQGGNDEQLAGVTAGSFKGTQSVSKLLNALDPFLDGGTLTLTYTPKPGVVKEWLTITQGKVGVKIPAKLSYKLSIEQKKEGKQLTIVPVGTPLQIFASMIERNVNAVELTPTRISIRLPWAPDPEFRITDEDVTPISHTPADEVYGASQPRSPQWPTVRKRHLEREPTCAACGLDAAGCALLGMHIEVHHEEEFSDNPDRELDPTNLVTFCRKHHFEVGHDPDGIDGPLTPRWDKANPYVRRDAKRVYDKLHPGKHKPVAYSVRDVASFDTGLNPYHPLTTMHPTTAHSATEHSHRCSKGHIWTHDPSLGPVSHNCPVCGEYQNVQYQP